MWHKRSRRRITGGKVKEKRKRRKSELGRETLPCKVRGNERRKKVGVRGKGNQKTRLQFAEKVNLTDPDTGDTTTEKIEEVVENPANPHFARRDIITKGAIIQTSRGKGEVTSRPGQEGQINAVKLES
ncbi:hypothetical protein AKJ51_03160 [candidate division MSBL1 archaeon SCGC-AAA382A20]|uniref:30S ribosomal protein S8e n=1 Tax=candidate division MSBL1 archaeon SCGC-AAA382A20 TaxID=1698280 RepID=A0A133VJT0_9EURY|nr:hypothetical protein AKJ51_03160 [candidate division MSBL1 archaeon SCGC-AAA382A20]